VGVESVEEWMRGSGEGAVSGLQCSGEGGC